MYVTDTVAVGQDFLLRVELVFSRRIGFAEAVQPAPQPEGAAPNHRVRASFAEASMVIQCNLELD